MSKEIEKIDLDKLKEEVAANHNFSSWKHMLYKQGNYYSLSTWILEEVVALSVLPLQAELSELREKDWKRGFDLLSKEYDDLMVNYKEQKAENESLREALKQVSMDFDCHPSVFVQTIQGIAKAVLQQKSKV